MVLFQSKFVALIGLTAATVLLPMAAQANAQLAIDKGCYACHGVYRRGDAPTFEQLSSRLGRLKGDAVAEQKFVAKYVHGETFEHIAAHERLSQESAQSLIHWLVEGAK
jgi:cytochrome c